MSLRPKINLPRTRMDIILESASVIGLLFSFFLVAHFWGILPERIPTHYNFSGRPDAWGEKTALISLPLIALLNFVIVAVLQRFPNIYNYPFAITEANAPHQYALARSLLGWLNFEIVWFFAYMEWRTVQIALGKSTGMGPLAVFVFIAAMLATMGIYIRQAYKAK